MNNISGEVQQQQQQQQQHGNKTPKTLPRTSRNQLAASPPKLKKQLSKSNSDLTSSSCRSTSSDEKSRSSSGCSGGGGGGGGGSGGGKKIDLDFIAFGHIVKPHTRSNCNSHPELHLLGVGGDRKPRSSTDDHSLVKCEDYVTCTTEHDDIDGASLANHEVEKIYGKIERTKRELIELQEQR